MIDPLDLAILTCLAFGIGCCLYAIYVTLRILRRLKTYLKGAEEN